MSTEVALWIIGAATVPTIGFFVFVYMAIVKNDRSHTDASNNCERRHNEVIQKHAEFMEILKNPESHGFGTRHMEKVIEDNTRVMRELVYYIRWMHKKDGIDPPPPLDLK
jgi:hypothetical protein